MSKKILILAANPININQLRLGEEVRRIDEALQLSKKREQFKLEQKWAVRLFDFYRAMLDIQPQIVHFCGHGEGEDGIVLEDDAGKAVFLQSDALGRMFAQSAVQCVLLNACYSEVQAEAISQHVDYVIGMKHTIEDRAAIKFAEAFYYALGTGNEIEVAFKGACSQLIGPKEHEIPVLKKSPTVTQAKPSLISTTGTDDRTDQNPMVKDLEDSFRYDAYISYVDKDPDATWVWDTLLPQLEQAGLRIAVSGDVETPGVTRIVNIEQGITHSKRTIIVLSSAYLADNMAEFENVLVQTMSIQEGNYRLLPIKFAPIDQNRLPTRLSMLTTLDLIHPRRAEREFDRLVQALQNPLPRS